MSEPRRRGPDKKPRTKERDVWGPGELGRGAVAVQDMKARIEAGADVWTLWDRYASACATKTITYDKGA